MYFSASECLHFLQGCGFKSILGPELRVLYVKGSPVERPLASHDASGQDISPYTERANLGKAEPQCPVGKSLSLGVCVLAFFFFCFWGPALMRGHGWLCGHVGALLHHPGPPCTSPWP